jgi:hypothetical protein
MALDTVQAIELKSASIDGGLRKLKPINEYVVVDRAPSTRYFGMIIGVTDEKFGGFDVLLSKVLSISDRSVVNTRKGPLKVGDQVLSVKVVNRRVDDIDARTDDGGRISFLPAEHVLCVVEDTELLPTNDLYLVSMMPDRRMFGSIEVLGNDKLEILSSEILSSGPKTVYGEPGMYALHRKIDGVQVDSFEIRKRFGANLKLIREKSLLGIATDALDDNPPGETNADQVHVPYKGL